MTSACFCPVFAIVVSNLFAHRVGSDEVISDDEGAHFHGIVDNGDGDTARSSDEERYA